MRVMEKCSILWLSCSLQWYGMLKLLKEVLDLNIDMSTHIIIIVIIATTSIPML